MFNSLSIPILTLTVVCVRAHLAYWPSQNILQPVQGLYVRPSFDGTSGDLFVAASEDNGVAKWVAEQPINYLPMTHSHAGIPYAYSSSLTSTKMPHDEIVTTQKRAVITSPTMKYTYPSDGSPMTSYPYAMPASPAVADGVTSQYMENPYANYAYSLFQYFYPYLMSAAFANAANQAKEPAITDESANAVAQPNPSVWSPMSSYYPWQYMMMNSNLWAQNSAANTGETVSSTPVTASSENTSV